MSRRSVQGDTTDNFAYRIAEGTTERYTKLFTLASGGVAAVRFITLAETRIRIKVRAVNSAKFEIYENPLFTTIGLWDQQRNANRHRDDSAPLFDPDSVFTLGDLLHVALDGESSEWILEGEGTYVIVLTDLSSDDNTVTVTVDYYT